MTNKCDCLKPNDTTRSLRKTFEFIQQNQLLSNGRMGSTTVFVALNLNETQVSTNTNDRVSSDNTLTGIVMSVEETNVTLLAKTKVPDIYEQYTISYTQMIEIDSIVVAIYWDEYVQYMRQLPPICQKCHDRYSELLENLNEVVEKYRGTTQYSLKIIFNGVQSRVIGFSEIDIIKNLVFVGKIYALPLTVIGGYGIIPICQGEAVVEEIVEEGSEVKHV